MLRWGRVHAVPCLVVHAVGCLVPCHTGAQGVHFQDATQEKLKASTRLPCVGDVASNPRHHGALITTLNNPVVLRPRFFRGRQPVGTEPPWTVGQRLFTTMDGNMWHIGPAHHWCQGAVRIFRRVRKKLMFKRTCPLTGVGVVTGVRVVAGWSQSFTSGCIPLVLVHRNWALC